IVTDIILPDGNGIEIYQTIKNRNLEVPIIFVTGYTEEDIPGEIKICCAPIIKKPFALKKFLKTVKNVLNNKKTFV
ncbi:MAG: response regulator, partial [Elusimicrobiales bacterium]